MDVIVQFMIARTSGETEEEAGWNNGSKWGTEVKIPCPGWLHAVVRDLTQHVELPTWSEREGGVEAGPRIPPSCRLR